MKLLVLPRVGLRFIILHPIWALSAHDKVRHTKLPPGEARHYRERRALSWRSVACSSLRSAVITVCNPGSSPLEARIAELDAMEAGVQVTASAIAKYGKKPPATSEPASAPASPETGMSAAEAAVKVLKLDKGRTWSVNDAHAEAIGNCWVPPTVRRDAMKVALMRVHRRYPDHVERQENPVSYRWRDDPASLNGSGPSHREADVR